MCSRGKRKIDWGCVVVACIGLSLVGAVVWRLVVIAMQDGPIVSLLFLLGSLAGVAVFVVLARPLAGLNLVESMIVAFVVTALVIVTLPAIQEARVRARQRDAEGVPGQSTAADDGQHEVISE